MQELFFLFGDSLTQQGYDEFGWVARLSNAYIRRLAVVNAGLSGYNTEMALAKLPLLVPPPSHGRIRLMTVLLGANDARLPNTLGVPQHVPLDEYRRNLAAAINHPQVREHDPRIVLITPPPVDERMCEADDRAKGIDQVRRTAEVTKTYADAARDVGRELGVVVLDAWTIFMERAGWKSGEPLVGSKEADQDPDSGLPSLLRDGLHLTPEGNKLLYESLIELVEKTWPDQTPDALPFVLPRWDDVEAWKGSQS
jgi:lysophospholipase L1-like esterase